MSHHKHNQPNRLLQESSPYLQQHAYNPVDWYPWGKEALDKAKTENKPILVSIGYSTCHWCHVMERESFEDAEVAAYMNEHFVNIKIDREERPDLDAIYMDAVMLVQDGQGGWPLNCFLLPNGQPFFGGTYFPPKPAHRRPSWIQVLQNLRDAYHNRYEDVRQQAEQITQHIQLADKQFVGKLDIATDESIFDAAYLQQCFENLTTGFDTQYGGFGSAPKFPATMALRFCLNYYLSNPSENQTALDHLQFSLQQMIQGGIYDQLGGGFARYTVDAAWLVPHFEKMLYDNALLIGLLADTYKLTKNQLYKDTIVHTLDWVAREMTSSDALFYSALDADSEGVEGKFYVWQKAEIDTILGDFSATFCAVYDVTKEGNWEHAGKRSNILNLPISIANFAVANGLELAALEQQLATARQQLLDARAKRVRPGLDHKVLLDWNAMLITAYAKSYQALQVTAYKDIAIQALENVLEDFRVSEEGLHLVHTNQKQDTLAFLDDYALLIEACLECDALVTHDRYLVVAREYAELVINEFLDKKDHLFYFTSAKQQDVLLHKKSVYDNATPSGNSTMVQNLQRLGILLDGRVYQAHAQKTLLAVQETVQKFPQSFGRWANALFSEAYPFSTITVRGKADSVANIATLSELQQQALFNTIIRLDDSTEQTEIMVCTDYTCHLPVQTAAEALNLLKK